MKRKEILPNLTINKCILNSIIKHYYYCYFLSAFAQQVKAILRRHYSMTGRIYSDVNTLTVAIFTKAVSYNNSH